MKIATNSFDVNPKWYESTRDLDILYAPWAESTFDEINFLERVLELRGKERILDLACGFGRHSIELAKRGYSVVGVDISEVYITNAINNAKTQNLDITFICSDLRDVAFRNEFDIVLNLADGAIGYLENDEENLKIFNLVSSSLVTGGKHLMEICNADYAKKYFPKRDWNIGDKAISLTDFVWCESSSRLIMTEFFLKYGTHLTTPKGKTSSIRLYTINEISTICKLNKMSIKKTFTHYSPKTTVLEEQFSLIVLSEKI